MGCISSCGHDSGGNSGSSSSDLVAIAGAQTLLGQRGSARWSASVERRSLAPGGGAWWPGAGLSERGSCCRLLAAAAAGAEGTASGRRAADSQAARGKVKPGERSGGFSSPAAAVQVPERPLRLKLRLGAQGICIACRERLQSQGFPFIAAGPGSGVFGVCSGRLLPSQDIRTRRQLCAAVLPSSLYCYCLSASRLTVSLDSSFVLIMPNPRSPRA